MLTNCRLAATKCDFIDRKEYRASDECDDAFFTELDDQMEAYENMIETLMAERAKGKSHSLTPLS